MKVCLSVTSTGGSRKICSHTSARTSAIPLAVSCATHVGDSKMGMKLSVYFVATRVNISLEVLPSCSVALTRSESLFRCWRCRCVAANALPSVVTVKLPPASKSVMSVCRSVIAAIVSAKLCMYRSAFFSCSRNRRAFCRKKFLMWRLSSRYVLNVSLATSLN